MADAEPVWEVARLVAELDPSIPDRLRAAHPATGRCRSCRTVAPCPPRRLADLAAALATRQVERHATRPDPPE